jgi:hypothetical protein
VCQRTVTDAVLYTQTRIIEGITCWVSKCLSCGASYYPHPVDQGLIVFVHPDTATQAFTATHPSAFTRCRCSGTGGLRWNTACRRKAQYDPGRVSLNSACPDRSSLTVITFMLSFRTLCRSECHCAVSDMSSRPTSAMNSSPSMALAT